MKELVKIHGSKQNKEVLVAESAGNELKAQEVVVREWGTCNWDYDIDAIIDDKCDGMPTGESS